MFNDRGDALGPTLGLDRALHLWYLDNQEDHRTSSRFAFSEGVWRSYFALLRRWAPIERDRWQMHHMKAEELMATMPDNSVDLILTDPPYYKVKNEPWDRQWDKPEAFLAWMGALADEWRRILKPNGSLYVFASPRMAARVELTIRDRFNVLNRVIWRKPPFSTKAEMNPKEWQRQFFPITEHIIFAEHYGNDDSQRGHTFGPVVDYLRAERDAAGLRNDQLDKLCGWRTKAFHFFAKSGSNFCLPTAENYEALQMVAPGHFLREYEDLRQQYEDLRRPFSVTADVPYTDVWDFPTVQAYPGKHPCEKPQPLLEHIIKASSREGAVVFDCFAGSGSTGRAAIRFGRRFIGCDASEHWAEYAAETIATEAGQSSPVLTTRLTRPPKEQPKRKERTQLTIDDLLGSA